MPKNHLLFQSEINFAFRPYMFFEHQSTFLLYRHDREQFLAFHHMLDIALPNMMVDLRIFDVINLPDENLHNPSYAIFTGSWQLLS